jgi:predicted secreted protein
VGRTLHVRVDETFEVPLEGQPTAGYRWELILTPAAVGKVALVEERWDPDVTRAGGPAVQRFRFRALSPGTLELTFLYRRPWETGAADRVEKVTITIARPS